MIELIVGLPQGVQAIVIHLDGIARMQLVAQDGQHEIMEASLDRVGLLSRSGLTVVARP